MISGIPLLSGLSSRMQNPILYVVCRAPRPDRPHARLVLGLEQALQKVMLAVPERPWHGILVEVDAPSA